MQALGLLFVLGLASAITPQPKKLTVWGVPQGLPLVQGIVGVPHLDTLNTPLLGLKSELPFGLQLGVLNPLVTPLVNLPQLNLRTELPIPKTLNDINTKPIILAVKTQPGVEELTVLLLEQGLNTLSQNPNTRVIDEIIKTGAEKSAIIINPTTVLDTPVYDLIKDLPIAKVEIPVGLRLGGLVNSIVPQVPIVLILETEEVNNLNVEGLIRLGNLPIVV